MDINLIPMTHKQIRYLEEVSELIDWYCKNMDDITLHDGIVMWSGWEIIELIEKFLKIEMYPADKQIFLNVHIKELYLWLKGEWDSEWNEHIRNVSGSMGTFGTTYEQTYSNS